MATKTKATEKNAQHSQPEEANKRIAHVAAPVTGPVPPALNDRREDGAPVLGHFVEVTKGEKKGFFGVFVEMQGDNAVVRSHNDVGNRISVPFDALRAASLHR